MRRHPSSHSHDSHEALATTVIPSRARYQRSRARRGVVAGDESLQQHDDRGDTLIEILLSLIILGLASLALIVAFGTSMTASGEHRSLTTGDTYVKTVANHVAGSVQSSTSNFSSCPANPSDLTSVLLAYTSIAGQVSLPSGYSASVTAVEYWISPTQGQAGSWGTSCIVNAPQLIAVTLTNLSTNATNTLSLVVDNPAAPPILPSGPATKLVFALQPSGAAVGAPMGGQPEVVYEDAAGDVVTNQLSPNPVTLSVVSGPGALINCSNPQSSNGYISFSGCELDTVGTYTLRATDGVFPAVNSASFTVSKGTNAISITSTSPSSVIKGQTTYTPVATATSGDTVSITSATLAVCTISPTNVVSFIGAGVCAINFNDPGNASYSAAPALAQGIAVYLPNTVTVTTAAPTPAEVNGTTYTPIATATSRDAVVVSSNSTSICIVASGQVSFVGVGTCSLQFHDPGNSTYVAADAYQSFSVGGGANSITVNSTSPQPPIYGATYSPTATASSGDVVVVTSATSATCSVFSGVVTFSGVGTCTLDFNDPGNTNYVAAVQVVQTMTVTRAPLGVSVSGTQPFAGAPVFTPTYSGLVNGDGASVVSGTLTCQTNATAASPPGGGFSISACSGLSATNYTLNYQYGTLTVVKATPIITWSTPSAITYGTTLSVTQLNATVTIAGVLVYSPASGTLLLPGSQTLGVTFTPTDTTDYTTATKTVTLLVNKAPQSLNLSAGASSAPWSSTITFSSSGQSGTGAVSYFVDAGANGNSSTSGICSVNAATGVLGATGAGNCYVYGVVATDAHYLAATSADQLAVFTTIPQSLSVSATPSSAGWTTALNLGYTGPGSGAVTYQLEGPSGTTLSDATAGANTGIANGGVTLGAAGPTLIGSNAISLSGTTGSYVSTSTSYNNPEPGSMSIWFDTTSVGDLMGFSSSQNDAAPVSSDRMMWIDNTGKLVAGVYNNATEEVTSTTAYNDGNWHLAVFTYGPSGEVLYVDGTQVASNIAGTVGQNYVGYWHIGYDNNALWPDAPSNSYFTGSLSHAAVFPSQLTSSQVSGLYGASSLASEDSGVLGLVPTSYWPLDNTVCAINATPGQLLASAPGTCYFTGTIAADANYQSAVSTVTSAVFTRANQSISTTTSQSSTSWRNTVTVGATGQSGSGVVSYSLDSGTQGNASSLSCALSGNQLYATAAGARCYVYVTIAPDSLYYGATSNDATVRFN